jgi:transcription antitermination factor NusG
MPDAGRGVMLGWKPAERLLQGHERDENRDAAPYPGKGQLVRVVNGPFTRFDGTVVDVDDFRRLVQAVVLVFGRATVICLDVLQLEAAR